VILFRYFALVNNRLPYEKAPVDEVGIAPVIEEVSSDIHSEGLIFS